MNKGRERQSQERGGCHVSGIRESGRTKCVFPLVGRNSVACPCFYHYFSKKPKTSLRVGPGPEVGMCIQEAVVSLIITWTWFTPGQVKSSAL